MSEEGLTSDKVSYLHSNVNCSFIGLFAAVYTTIFESINRGCAVLRSMFILGVQ